MELVIQQLGGTLYLVSFNPPHPHLPDSTGFGSFEEANGWAREMAAARGIRVKDQVFHSINRLRSGPSDMGEG